MIKSRLKKIEKVTLLKSLGRVLAQDIMAARDEPTCNVSPINGIALRFIDRDNALWQVGSIELGQNPVDNLSKNECLSVQKGVKLPLNADAICLAKDTYLKDGQLIVDTASLYKAIKQGSTYKQEQILLNEGQIICPDSLAILAKNNISELSVYSKLNIHLKIDTPYVDTDNFEITDYRVRDYFTPYIQASLPGTYNMVGTSYNADIHIIVVNSLEEIKDSLHDGDGFSIFSNNNVLCILCTCNFKSLQNLIKWFENQKFTKN